MKPFITAITTTVNRPAAFALCEQFMARQTVRPDQWIVADGGDVPAVPTMGQRHVWRPMPPGARNLACNLLNALERARGDLIVFIEDDDWYHQDHIRCLVAMGERFPLAVAFGDPMQRYYNVPQRKFRTFDNVGASLCQTAISSEASALLQHVIHSCMARDTYGIDTTFWRALPAHTWGLQSVDTVVGMKGLPGQPGLGIGHRPAGPKWHDDPSLQKLKDWIGADLALYTALGASAAV